MAHIARLYGPYNFPKDKDFVFSVKHSAEKPGCKVAIILIYEDEFDETLFPAALVRYAGLENAEDSWVAFDEVICMQDGKIVYQKSHPFE